jgi:hypothetical protein
MSYLIIHRSSFLFRSAPLMRDTCPRHWNLRKMNHILPQYLFNKRSWPTAVKCISRTRCSKFTRIPCIPTREDVWWHYRVVIKEWSHRRQITLSTTTNRVIDHRDHTMGHEMSRATPETGRIPIPIILHFYLATDVFLSYLFLTSFLPLSSQISGWDFL